MSKAPEPPCNDQPADKVIEKDGRLVISAGDEPLTAEDIRELRLRYQR